MWHVTDGDLHAYLDGALDLYPAREARRIRSHLESCADCRGRLAEEERVREAASSVLAETGPASVDVPPFEAVRRRAAAGPARPEGSGRRPGPALRLGWAASVLVALGVGWMVGREPAARSGAGTAPTAAADAARREAAPAAGAPEERTARLVDSLVREPTTGERDLIDAPPTVAAAEARADDPAPEDPEEQMRAAPETVAVDRIQLAETADRSAAPEIAVPAAPEQESAAVVDTALPAHAGRLTGRAVASETDAPLAGATVVVEGTSVGATTDEDGRYVLGPVPPGRQTLRLTFIGREAVTETVTVRPGATEVVDFSPPARALALRGLRVTGVPAPADSLRAADLRVPDSVAAARARVEDVTIAPTTFEEAAGAASAGFVGSGEAVRTLLIPGLDVLQVGWTEVAPGVDGLLVVQRLVGDTTRLELRFGGLEQESVGAAAARRNPEAADSAPAVGEERRRSSGDPSAMPPPSLLEEPLPEGVAQVTGRLPEGGGWVVLRGRLPRERLLRLLELVVGG